MKKQDVQHMRKQDAQFAYRAAWAAFVLTVDQRKRMPLMRLMDDVQPDCVDSRGPGPEWEAFAASLPGFVEYWKTPVRSAFTGDFPRTRHR